MKTPAGLSSRKRVPGGAAQRRRHAGRQLDCGGGSPQVVAVGVVSRGACRRL
jgi:hypothetical protein